MRNQPAERQRRAPDLRHLGRAIRGLRRDLGWTLTQLSERCGLSVAFLSQVENNRAQPSAQSLAAIAAALGCAAADIIGAASAGHTVEVGRAARRSDAGDRSVGRIGPVEVTELCRRDGAGEDWHSHIHDAVLYVVRGDVEVTTASANGDVSHLLGAGDSIRCGGGVAYRWRCPAGEAVVLAVRVDDAALIPPR